MIDYPFTHGKYQGIMTFEMCKKTSSRKWTMEQDKPAGGLLKFHQYVIARRSEFSSTERPVTPNTAPLSPASNTAAPPSPSTHAADLSLHDKMYLLERKVDDLFELIKGLMAKWDLSATPEVPLNLPPEVPEPSALSTLASFNLYTTADKGVL